MTSRSGIKLLSLTALCLSLLQALYAAPLYQWSDKDGSTRMTVQVPPPHATHVRKMLRADLPPMNDQSTAASTINSSPSSILIPQNQNSSSAKRRLYESTRASQQAEERYMQDMQEEEARAEYLRNIENEYNEDAYYNRYQQPFYDEPRPGRPPSIRSAAYSRSALSPAAKNADENDIPGGQQSVQAVREATELTAKALKANVLKPAVHKNAQNRE